MRESIYTIPVHEVLEEKNGCPVCRIRNLLEQRTLEYIMGAAMMEPDVRIETNKKGFCEAHYRMLLQQKNRLSLALMLQTHLEQVTHDVFEQTSLPLLGGAEKKAKNALRVSESCFVCNKVDHALAEMVDTILLQYSRDAQFVKLFSEQQALCLPHYRMLFEAGRRKLSKKDAGAFEKVIAGLAQRTIQELYDDVSHFCRMFDYRNNTPDADWGNARDSIERAIWFLTSRHPDEKK